MKAPKVDKQHRLLGWPDTASTAWCYTLALMAVGVAFLVRWWVDPILKERLPFTTFYLAVAYAVWRCGIGPAVMAGILGFILSNYFFVIPRNELIFFELRLAIMIMGYGLVTGALCILGGLYRRDRQRILGLLDESMLQNARLDEEIKVRRKAEEALQKSQALLQSLTDNSPAVVFIKDPQGRHLFVNRQFEKVLHQTKESLLGKTDHEMFPEDVAESLVKNDREVLARCHPQHYEDRVPHHDGLHHYYTIKFPLMDAHGQVYAVGGMALDITELKRIEEALRDSEARLHLAQTGAGLGLWDWNISNETAFWSKLAWDFYGVTPRDQPVTYELWRSCLHPEDRERACQQVADVIAHGTDYVSEYRVLKPDGSVCWISSRGRVIRDACGKATRMIGILVNVNQLKEVEAELRSAQQQLTEHARNLEALVAQRTEHLEETLHSLELLLYNLAHDLRAPNRTMEGYSQVLLADYASKLDKAAREHLERIAQAARRNDTLIRDLLAYGRLSHVELACRRMNLCSAVKAALEKMEPEIEAAQAKVTVQEPMPEVLAHPTVFQQILSQLLSNALKFVPPGVRPEIEISCQEKPGLVRLVIRDNGIGIAPEHHSKIFGVFHRLTNDQSDHGTGIGLAIVEKAVHRMGGRVGVDSALGKGSSFWVELSSPEKRSQQQPQNM